MLICLVQGQPGCLQHYWTFIGDVQLFYVSIILYFIMTRFLIKFIKFQVKKPVRIRKRKLHVLILYNYNIFLIRFNDLGPFYPSCILYDFRPFYPSSPHLYWNAYLLPKKIWIRKKNILIFENMMLYLKVQCLNS